MQELFRFLNTYVFSTLSLDGPGIFFGVMLAVPALLALLITLGDWKAVLKSMLIWYGGLFAVFLFATASLQDALHGALMYAMVFSIVAVPCIAMLIKLQAWIKARWSPRTQTH